MNSESRLVGQGTISGDLTNASEFTPGRSFNIGGNYVQQIGGTLSIDVAGTAAGEFDVISVAGTANLLGELNVVLEGEFGPSPSDPNLVFMTFASSSGGFSSTELAGYELQPAATNLSLAFAETSPELSAVSFDDERDDFFAETETFDTELDELIEVTI